MLHRRQARTLRTCLASGDLSNMQAARTLTSRMGLRKTPVFAPLRQDKTTSPDFPRLQGVVFDVDGTLCEPQNYMFGQMRDVLGITKSQDILEHIYGLPTAEEQQQAMESVRGIERTAMASQVAQPGLVSLMQYLQTRGVRKAICTRNFQAPVDHLLGKFLAGHIFDPIITREFRPPKPDPAGILHIAKSWGLVRQGEGGPGTSLGGEESRPQDTGGVRATDPGEVVADASGLIMVGDSIDDMEAGFRAGAATVLLVNDANRHLSDSPMTDLVISRLDELVSILENGFRGRTRLEADEPQIKQT